jgi:hypothetical protein
MKILKGTHKALLFNLFYEKGRNPYTGQEGMVPKEFPLEKLMDAGSAKKKILPVVEQVNDQQRLLFNDGEIEFIPAEIAIIKELFDAKRTWAADDAEIVQELKDIFNPPVPSNA